MLKMVDFIEFFMLPSSEFQLMTLIKNIGGDGHLILGVYIYPVYIYHFRHRCVYQAQVVPPYRTYSVFTAGCRPSAECRQ